MLCSHATQGPLSGHTMAFMHLGLHAFSADAPRMLRKLRKQVGVQQDCRTLPHLPAAVDALGVGDHQLELLGKLRQARAGVPRRGDQDLGVALARVRVLVVHVRARHGRVVVLQLHLPPQVALLAPQLARDGLGLCAPRARTSAGQLVLEQPGLCNSASAVAATRACPLTGLHTRQTARHRK